MGKINFAYILGTNMYYAYIQYLNSNMEVCKKSVGEIKNSEDIASKVIQDIYMLEYMYMPMATLLIEEDEKIILKYSVEKIDERFFLVSR
jgi:hypothetical protein